MDNKNAVILITGVSGRIGSSCAALFSKKYQVVGFDVIEPKQEMAHVAFFNVDLTSDQSVRAALQKVKEKYGNYICSVIHLAAYYSFSKGSWNLYEKITIQGTERLIKSVQDFKVDQFIFSSTMLVYAPCKVGKKIHEQSKVEPKWDYPLSKVKTEEIIHKNRGSISTVILRISGVYDDLCHSIPISNQIQRIYEKQLESHLFPGDITHGASFLHMHDLVSAIELAVEKRKELPAEVMVVLGEPETLSYDEMQKEIGQLLYHKSWKTFKVPKWFAKMGAYFQDKLPFVKKSFIKPWMIDIADDHYELDVSRAKEILGWQPRYAVRSSLKRMIGELKKDPKKWYLENLFKLPKSFPKL